MTTEMLCILNTAYMVPPAALEGPPSFCGVAYRRVYELACRVVAAYRKVFVCFAFSCNVCA